jgi:hypothetical protein
VRFVVDKVALGQVFFECFGFLCQFSFNKLLHTHLSSGAGTTGQTVADVPSGLSLTPPQENKKKVVPSADKIRGTIQVLEECLEKVTKFLKSHHWRSASVQICVVSSQQNKKSYSKKAKQNNGVMENQSDGPSRLAQLVTHFTFCEFVS